MSFPLWISLPCAVWLLVALMAKAQEWQDRNRR